MVDEKPALPPGNLLFPLLFQSFRLAIQPSKLAIAFAAVAIIGLTGWTMDLHPTVITADSFTVLLPRETSTEPQLHRIQNATELDLYAEHGTPSLRIFVESRRALGNRVGVFRTLWRFGAEEFHRALYAVFTWDPPRVIRSVARGLDALLWAFRWHTVYSLAFFTVAFTVLMGAGGALCRMTALQFARAEGLGPLKALRFSWRRFTSLMGGSVGPALLVLAFGAPIILIGLIGNLPGVGELLTGLLLPLALVAACAVVITLLGAAAGLGLMSPAVAYEDADAFDAINHAFSYVYSKPWHMGFYTLVAIVYGALCYLFVRFFAYLLLATTYTFLRIGFLRQGEKLEAIWPEPTFASFLGPAGSLPEGWSLWLAALLIRLSVLAVIGLVVAFVVSFHFSAHTIIYALMRHRVHGTPLDEVYASPNGASAALPSFEADSGAIELDPAVARDGGSDKGPQTSG